MCKPQPNLNDFDVVCFIVHAMYAYLLANNTTQFSKRKGPRAFRTEEDPDINLICFSRRNKSEVVYSEAAHADSESDDDSDDDVRGSDDENLDDAVDDEETIIDEDDLAAGFSTLSLGEPSSTTAPVQVRPSSVLARAAMFGDVVRQTPAKSTHDEVPNQGQYTCPPNWRTDTTNGRV